MDDEIDLEDIGSNPAPARTVGEMIEARMTRRAALRGLAGAGAAVALTEALVDEAVAQPLRVPAQGGPSTLTFPELRHQLSQNHMVAEGYEAQIVIRWGDPVLAGAPAYDPMAQTAEAQGRQFGYNCDYIDFWPLPAGSRNSDHGLLCVNHEYTNTNLMFAGIGEGRAARGRTTAAQAAIEIEAHGMSVVEVRKENGTWRSVPGGAMNRRITMNTPMVINGPAAGHARLKTNADPTGTRVLGTLNNCAGGNTPWGTVITAEENFNNYFGGEAARTGAEAAAYRRYGIIPAPSYAWYRHFPRFNLDTEPNEPHRFGWIVEYDPYDPDSVPVKRTALGRFKHEGATHAVGSDGRVAFYMGDDERFEYLYKFVTARAFNPNDRAANRDLMDDGTLYVAKFEEQGRMRWLALTHGEGPLTAANGFHSQADVVIEARRAADLLGATPMDRPEDVETNPVNGRVYVMLTNNSRRTAQQAGPANPRAANMHGHVLVYFGFTYCPDVCPTELGTMAAAMDLLEEQGAQVTPMLITIDPERDTPEALADYVSRFHPRLVGLTGSAEQIAAAARAYRVFYAKVNRPEMSQYLMDHSSFIYLSGPDGRVRALFRPETTPEAIAQSVRAHLRSRG